ncbi:MAG: sigma-70 family RNA polymerase sigma factor [Gemmatimonadaceae bacterium]|nr:sigma-70 family RNA polymerase sigma factor [Acetobacteraceae bacterium]
MVDDAPLDLLLAAVARREQPALRTIYDREATRLFGIAMAILRDRPAASDAVQDGFLRLWQRAGQYDPARGEARAWINTIVRHAALDIARARGRELPTADPALGDQPVEADAVERLEASEDNARLRDCLTQLDEKNRRMITLAFVEGLSHAQISARLDVPLGSVKTWIRRGLVALRKCLG